MTSGATAALPLHRARMPNAFMFGPLSVLVCIAVELPAPSLIPIAAPAPGYRIARALRARVRSA